MGYKFKVLEPDFKLKLFLNRRSLVRTRLVLLYL
jgi:hypothetical protein